MKVSQKLLLLLTVVAIAVLFAMLVFARQISSDAVAALIGVLAGGAISGFIQYEISVADRDQQLRTAALEKRLQAHQEAYALWRRLLFTHGEELFDVMREASDWWNSHCLYLSAEARRAFYRSINVAGDLEREHRAPSDKRVAALAMRDLEAAGDVIVEGVALPGFGKEEAEPLGVITPKERKVR